MIFVITGSEAFPFDRLVKEIDSLKSEGVITTDVFIQLGSCSYVPVNCMWEQWLPFDKMREKISASEMVIAHAGAGTTLLCLEMGKMPLLVTRRKEHGEHVDDHQVEFAGMMDKIGYAAVAYDVSELSSLFKRLFSQDLKMVIENRERSKLISSLNNWFLSDI